MTLEIREAGDKGRGLFATRGFQPGDVVIALGGTIFSTADLPDDWMALQVGPDHWLASNGDHLDDYANHSCEPNAGFATGELKLIALATISPGDEITWDYSTSIDVPGWSLDCRCGSATCRKVVLPWRELDEVTRKRLRRTAIAYLR